MAKSVIKMCCSKYKGHWKMCNPNQKNWIFSQSAEASFRPNTIILSLNELGPSNTVLGDRFPRKNSRRHNSIYNVLLVTDTIQVCSITNSIVSFQSGIALCYCALICRTCALIWRTFLNQWQPIIWPPSFVKLRTLFGGQVNSEPV